jgi:hypothetical protein
LWPWVAWGQHAEKEGGLGYVCVLLSLGSGRGALLAHLWSGFGEVFLAAASTRGMTLLCAVCIQHIDHHNTLGSGRIFVFLEVRESVGLQHRQCTSIYICTLYIADRPLHGDVGSMCSESVCSIQHCCQISWRACTVFNPAVTSNWGDDHAALGVVVNW